MKKFFVSFIASMGLAASVWAAFPITGYVQVNPPIAPQPGGFNIATGTVNQFTDTGLSSGGCVQAAAGGLFTTTGLNCGSGGGGSGVGTINSAPQYSAGFYSAVSSTIISGLSPGTSGQQLITAGSTTPPYWGTPISTITAVSLGVLTLSSATATYLQILNAASTYAPILGSANYIQNGTVLQTASFNTTSGTVSGPFNASTIDSVSGYTQDGSLILSANDGLSDNTSAGIGSQNIANASGNSSFGYQAGTAENAPRNTAIGVQALFNNISQANNTAVGYQSLYYTTGGNSNTALGFQSGIGNISGTNNTFLGATATSASSNLTNATAIGYGATVSNSNTIQLGNNVNVIASTYTTTGEYCFQDGTCQISAAHGGGNIVSSPQFQLGYYSQVGTTNTITGITGVTTTNNGDLSLTGVLTIGSLTSTSLGNNPYSIFSASGTSQAMQININGTPSGGAQNEIGGLTINGPSNATGANSPALLVIADSTTNNTNGAGLAEIWEGDQAHNSYLLWFHGSSTRNSDEPIRFDGPTWGIDEVNTSTGSTSGGVLTPGGNGLGKWKVIDSGYQTTNLQLFNSRSWDNSTFEPYAYVVPLTQSYLQAPGLYLNSQSLTNDSGILTSSDTTVFGWQTLNNHNIWITGPLNTTASFGFGMPSTPNNLGQVMVQTDNGRGNNNNTRSLGFTTGGTVGQVLTYQGTSSIPSWTTVSSGGGTGASFTDQLLPCQVTNPTSSTLVFGSSATATHPCTVSFGETIYQFVSSSTLTLGLSTGTARVYFTNGSDGNGTGTLQAIWSAGSALTGSGINVTNNTSQYPSGSIPIITWNATSAGTWDASAVSLTPVYNGEKQILGGSAITKTEIGTSISLAFNGQVVVSTNSTYGIIISTSSSLNPALLSVSTIGVTAINGAIQVSSGSYLISVSSSNLAPWTTGFALDTSYNLTSSGSITATYGINSSTANFTTSVIASSISINGPFNSSGNATIGNNAAQVFIPNLGNGSSGIKFVEVSAIGGNPLTSAAILQGDIPSVITLSSLTVIDTSSSDNYEGKLSTSATAGIYSIAITTTNHISSGGVVTSTSSCGTGAGFSGTDVTGIITPGATAAGCTITFGSPWKNVPSCIVSEQTMSLVNALSYTVTTTALTITQTSLSSKLNYLCIGIRE